MKRMLAVLMVTTLLGSAVPVFAAEHGAAHQSMDEKCTKECEMLLRNCALEVDTLQQHIARLKTAIKDKGASTSTGDELKRLEKQLKDANEMLNALEQS